MRVKLKLFTPLEILLNKVANFIFLTGFIFCLLLIVSAIPFAYAENISLEDVFASPEEFSEQEIQIEGEVIGEALNDAGGIWLNVSTGSQQIGVFSADKGMAEEITYWGSYSATGDQVRVKGIFYKECPDHQISDMHLGSLEVIRRGYRNEYKIFPRKQKLAKILSIICLTIAFIYFIKLKYGKRD